MKKFLFIISAILAVALLTPSVNAQDKTVSSDVSFVVKGATADTVVNGDTVNYDIYVRDFCESATFGIRIDSVRGTITDVGYIETSIDYVHWTRADTIVIAQDAVYPGTRKWGLGSLIEPKLPYIRVVLVCSGAGTGRYFFYAAIKTN